MQSKIIALTLCFLISTNAFAEDKARGRTEDGRAYRTDNQGNQLVDYIAELELNIDSLNRQVQGLESESQEKQNVIERLRSGSSSQGEILERDISARNSAANLKNAAVKQVECEPKIIEKDCPAPVAAKVISCPTVDCSTDVKAEKIKCTQSIEDLRVDKDLIIQKQISENQSLKANLQALQADVRQARDETKSTQDQLTSAVKNAQTLEEKQESLRKIALTESSNHAKAAAASADSSERASLKADRTSATIVRSDDAANTALTQTRIQAVDILRIRMLSDLSSLQGLIAYRDKLYQDARRRTSYVDEPSETSEAIGALKGKIRDAERVTDLSVLRTEVGELRGTVQQEIALLKRSQKTN